MNIEHILWFLLCICYWSLIWFEHYFIHSEWRFSVVSGYKKTHKKVWKITRWNTIIHPVNKLCYLIKQIQMLETRTNDHRTKTPKIFQNTHEWAGDATAWLKKKWLKMVVLVTIILRKQYFIHSTHKLTKQSQYLVLFLVQPTCWMIHLLCNKRSKICI